MHHSEYSGLVPWGNLTALLPTLGWGAGTGGKGDLVRIETLVVGDLGANCYLAYDPTSSQGIVIDPGDEGERILQRVATLGIQVAAVVLTHFHFDHVLAAEEVARDSEAHIAIHRADSRWLEESPPLFRQFIPHPPSLRASLLLAEGDELAFGGARLKVLHTPGHSPGGISLWSEAEGLVFTGDALFAGSVGRTDLPGGNHAKLIDGIRTRLLALPDETIVYPGHGPSTTVGAERGGNPWLQA